MRKFIITEEERKHILSLYEQQSTDSIGQDITQQSTGTTSGSTTGTTSGNTTEQTINNTVPGYYSFVVGYLTKYEKELRELIKGRFSDLDDIDVMAVVKEIKIFFENKRDNIEPKTLSDPSKKVALFLYPKIKEFFQKLDSEEFDSYVQNGKNLKTNQYSNF
jgi:hypothetical protein